MAAAVLNNISPTFLWAGQTTRLRVNGTGINSNAILRIIKSTSTLDATNVTVAGDGSWIEGDLVVPSNFPLNPQYNVRVINTPPSTDPTTLSNALDVRAPGQAIRPYPTVFITDPDEFFDLMLGKEKS